VFLTARRLFLEACISLFDIHPFLLSIQKAEHFSSWCFTAQALKPGLPANPLLLEFHFDWDPVLNLVPGRETCRETNAAVMAKRSMTPCWDASQVCGAVVIKTSCGSSCDWLF
jgi:hypothetical protein